MLLDFDKIENSVMPEFLGGKKEFNAKIYNDGSNKIMYGKLILGASIGMHTHTANSETIYFLSGTGKMLYQDTEERVAAGLCHHCPKGHSHSLINDSDKDLIFFAVVPQQ